MLASVPIMSKISRWDPPPVEVTSGYVIPGVAREIRHRSDGLLEEYYEIVIFNSNI